MHERPTTFPRSRCAAQGHNMFPTAPTTPTPYAQRPPILGDPLVPHPAGSPGYSGAPHGLATDPP